MRFNDFDEFIKLWKEIIRNY